MSQSRSTSKVPAHRTSTRKRALAVLTGVSALVVGFELTSCPVPARAATPPIHDPAMHAPSRAPVVRTDAPPFTMFTDPRHDVVHPRDVAAGPDGNLWFTAARDRVGRITPEGRITLYRDPTGLLRGRIDSFDGTPAGVEEPSAITAGPDGSLWFTTSNDRIGRITPAGQITAYDGTRARVQTPFGITTGPDGNVWFTSLNSNRIGFIQPSATEAG